MRQTRMAIPLRLWLVALVVVTVLGMMITEVAFSQAMGAWQFQADTARLTHIREIIGNDPSRWNDAGWQHAAGPRLHALGVEAEIVRVTGAHSAGVAYTTPGAVSLLSPISGALLHTQTYVSQGPVSELIPMANTIAPTYEKVLVRGPGGAVRAVVLLWFISPAPNSPSPWLWPLAAVLAVAAIMAAVLWLFGRSVLWPLRALNRAVEGIAGGDLDVHLSPSSAREVTEISAAVEGMSGTLRESLTRQSELEEERRLFIGAVAHDLRTPLFTLRGYLKGLQSGVAATPEKRAQYVDVCLAKADALEHLIADLFDFTRLEYLEQEPDRQPLDLADLLREATEGIRPAAAARGIVLVFDADGERCPVEGDPHLLRRAAENLLDNALRYTPDGGAIRVAWGSEGERAHFTVRDSGPGIAEKDLPRIFTPLYRGEESRNRQTGGAGLGLAIAERILRGHGGGLAAANGADGGAVFTATLPRAARSLPSPQALTGSSTCQGGDGSLTRAL